MAPVRHLALWLCLAASLSATAARAAETEIPAASASSATPAAGDVDKAASGEKPATGASDQPQTGGPEAANATPSAAPETPFAAALKRLLERELPADASDEEKKESETLRAFYAARAQSPIWIEAGAVNARARAVAAEIANAAAYGLDPKDFPAPAIAKEAASLDPEALAEAEFSFSLTALKYARFARGGRIIAPSEQLSTQLDRRPQLLDPKIVLDGLASAPDPDKFLAGTNPRHPQFERLREKLIALTAGGAKLKKGSSQGLEAKRLLANMEMWRWMPENLGEVHMMANVPEFMIRLLKDGTVIHTERVVAGMLDKQTAIFSRPLKNIVLRPMWRVPESIKVKELWPSMLRGGGLMRQYGLELETKDGRSLDWRAMDWTKEDIRNYEVVQPPGRKSVLGVVKFSFPSQHTIFMHDTPDKWMFNARQRTLSHGCLRLRNPVRMAELILAEDKGWDPAKIAELIKSGPLNNEVVIEKKIRMHITYFTAWVDNDGKLKTFNDIYGHEKRIRLALDGRWSEIDKGKDHLAPVELNSAPVAAKQGPPGKPKSQEALADFVSSFFGSF